MQRCRDKLGVVKESCVGGLTILPRLNSLNQEPGVSLGQLDILTCNKIK